MNISEGGRHSEEMMILSAPPQPPTQEEINSTLFEVFQIHVDDFTVKSANHAHTEPELYSFEDCAPMQTAAILSSSNCSPYHRSSVTAALNSSLGDEIENLYLKHVTESGKKELHRAKTLPIIKTLFQDETSVSSPKQCGPKHTTVNVLHILKQSKGSPGAAWKFDGDSTDSSTSSETIMTGSDEVTLRPFQKGPLYYTTPPKANITRNQVDKNRRSGTFHQSDPTLSGNRQRSVSCDVGDGRTIKMFSSQGDSLQIHQVEKPSLRTSPSDPGMRSHGGTFYRKPPKSGAPKKRTSISNTDTDSSTPGKSKKPTKECKTNDITALFDAVENQDLDTVKDILETNGIDINSVNSEYLTPLDIAIMTNNIPMAKILLTHGARESPMFANGDVRCSRIDALVSRAEQRVVELTAAVLNGASLTNSSSSQQKENERQLCHWEFRHKLLKRMKAGYDHARCPDPPTNVSLSIASNTSLLVHFSEPLNRNGAVVTKYKVEWSLYENFEPLAGDLLLHDVRNLEIEIMNLKKATPYFIRVSAMNMKGFSAAAPSIPACAQPSSWHDLEDRPLRFHGKLKVLGELFTQVKNLRLADAPEIKDHSTSPSPVRKKKGSLKHLFSSAPKFQKTLKRGVYLACYCQCEDKVLVTSEEQLPIVEVDENFAGPSLHLDLYWLMKVACTWDDVKSLQQDMERSTAEGKVHFRGKLLQAVSVLQNSLGVYDLGKFYYKPLKDHNGSVVLAIVNFIADPKTISFSSGRWVPLSRFQRRMSQTFSDIPEEHDCITSSINEMTLFHEACSKHLTSGLYLGYVKLQASVDLPLKVLVSKSSPNVLPNVKVRDLSNISLEEWQWLKLLSSEDHKCGTTNDQQTFYSSFSRALEKLFKMLGISEDYSLSHRLYDLEVIELSPHVSFILILPPAEDLCIVPGQSDKISEQEQFTLIPVHVFELFNLGTYQPQMISKYSRLSSILEMDIILAQQIQREAFSKEELNFAKERVHQLLKLQNDFDKVWKGMRWIMDIISQARSRSCSVGISVKCLQISNINDLLTPEITFRGEILDNNNHENFNTNSQDSNEISVGKENKKIAKFYDPNEEISEVNEHLHSFSMDGPTSNTEHSWILRVYAAYETGLAKGTSVRLQATLNTTAREVINLVVESINQSAIDKGKLSNVYSEEQLLDFCLVAVIGARERILRDDYCLLHLQNPWTHGCLYVRMKHDLLAAIKQGQASTV